MTADKQSWPASKIVKRKTDELIPYARNSRTHSDTQVAQIAASVREFGWTVPVLIDEENTLIAGHGRVLAAQRLGIESVPCMIAKGWTENQKRAYVIADNKLTMNGGWDDDMLATELSELKDSDFDVLLTGFDDDEISSLLGLDDDDDDEPQPLDDTKFILMLELPNEKRLAEEYERAEREGIKCKIIE